MVLERLLPAINPETPLQNVIWSFTTQGDRGIFSHWNPRKRVAKLREKNYPWPTRLQLFKRWIELSTG